MRSRTQSVRSCSVRPAKSAVPAAPSSERAALWNPASRSGLRLVASSSARARRAAGDLGPPVDLRHELRGGDELLGRIALVSAVHVGGGDGDEMRQRRRAPSRAARSAASSAKVSATRDGPEQVHLDGAVQRGVEGHRRRTVDHDVAGRQQVPPVLVEAETVAPDVSGDRVQPAGDLVVEPLAELARSRSKQSLRRISRLVRSAGACRWPGRTITTTSHSGTLRSRRSTSAVPRKPVAPVTAIRRPASSSGITSVFLAPGCGPEA